MVHAPYSPEGFFPRNAFVEYEVETVTHAAGVFDWGTFRPFPPCVRAHRSLQTGLAIVTIAEKMNVLFIGVILIILGFVLLFVSRRNRRDGKRSTVSASQGSVAVGGDANAPIFNSGTIASPEPGGHWLTVVGIIAELGGIAAVIWHATHLGGR